MSLSACAKKAACNPPVVAAVETADRMVDLIVQFVEDGGMTDAYGDRLILEFAASDDRYVAEQKMIQAKVISALAAVETAMSIRKTSADHKEDQDVG